MRTIGVVPTSPAVSGIYLPLLRRLHTDPDLGLYLLVAGMHLMPEFGMTVHAIEADGFEIADRIETPLSSDAPEGITRSMGQGLLGFADTYARLRPDILVVLGDRFEMHAAALAALPFKIPVAHLYGGELTQGAIDDSLRHCITKLSHLHFVSTAEYARRVIQLGENPDSVVVAGALGLDNLNGIHILGPRELEARFGLRLDSPPLLVTFHPVTLEFERTEWQARELLAALESSGYPVIFTLPNADTKGRTIIRLIKEYVKCHSHAQMVDNLGTQGYFSMKVAAAMVGNSSSGILEAPSFQLPVVNIGSRQRGRLRADNVIDVGYDRNDILAGIRRAVQPGFCESLKNKANPYCRGNAAERIATRLKSVVLDDTLVIKRFHDIPAAADKS